MQLSSPLTSTRLLVSPPGRATSTRLRHARPLRKATIVRFREQPYEASSSARRASKDPHRHVDETTDEESNMPDDPLDMDDELVNVPQRPFIEDIYSHLPHHERPGAQTAAGKATKVTPEAPSHGPQGSVGYSGKETSSSPPLQQHQEQHHVQSGLPPPDPNASSVASLDDEDLEVAAELTSMFRFEGAEDAAKQIKKEHDESVAKHKQGGSQQQNAGDAKQQKDDPGSAPESGTIPGSHEQPNVTPSPDSKDPQPRKDKKTESERDSAKMQANFMVVPGRGRSLFASCNQKEYRGRPVMIGYSGHRVPVEDLQDAGASVETVADLKPRSARFDGWLDAINLLQAEQDEKEMAEWGDQYIEEVEPYFQLIATLIKEKAADCEENPSECAELDPEKMALLAAAQLAAKSPKADGWPSVDKAFKMMCDMNIMNREGWEEWASWMSESDIDSDMNDVQLPTSRKNTHRQQSLGSDDDDLENLLSDIKNNITVTGKKRHYKDAHSETEAVHHESLEYWDDEPYPFDKESGYFSSTEAESQFSIDAEEEFPHGSGLHFAFKAEDDDDDKKTGRNVLRSLAEKATDVASEVDPLERLSEARETYLAQRRLTKEALERSAPGATAVRVVEVAAGRAAIAGIAGAFVSEMLYGQSVLSQILGRFDGHHQVEFALPQCRSAAVAVVLLSLGITAIEAVLRAKPPPTGKLLGTSPNMQLWAGRLSMAVFLALVLYETMHSNRPVFPFWYLF